MLGGCERGHIYEAQIYIKEHLKPLKKEKIRGGVVSQLGVFTPPSHTGGVCKIITGEG